MNIMLRNDRNFKEMSTRQYQNILLYSWVHLASERGDVKGKAERGKGTRQSSCRVGAEGASRNAVSSGVDSSLSEDPFPPLTEWDLAPQLTQVLPTPPAFLSLG